MSKLTWDRVMESVQIPEGKVYVHLGKGFSSDGFRMFRFPSDFDLKSIKDAVSSTPLKLELFNILERTQKTPLNFTMPDNHTGINSDNFIPIVDFITNNDLWKGANAVVVYEGNSFLVN